MAGLSPIRGQFARPVAPGPTLPVGAVNQAVGGAPAFPVPGPAGPPLDPQALAAGGRNPRIGALQNRLAR